MHMLGWHDSVEEMSWFGQLILNNQDKISHQRDGGGGGGVYEGVPAGPLGSYPWSCSARSSRIDNPARTDVIHRGGLSGTIANNRRPAALSIAALIGQWGANYQPITQWYAPLETQGGATRLQHTMVKRLLTVVLRVNNPGWGGERVPRPRPREPLNI